MAEKIELILVYKLKRTDCQADLFLAGDCWNVSKRHFASGCFQL